MGIDDSANEPYPERLNEAYQLLRTDPSRAIGELQQLAEKGSLSSMLHLGWAYQKGTGRPVDLAQAETWFRRAFEKGSMLGGYYLGHLYLERKEYSKAHEIFTAGASMNYSPAIFCLGHMYMDGQGVEKDLSKARSLFEKASMAGHVFAKRTLAKLLLSGQFGLLNVFKGSLLFFGAVKDGIVVGSTDPSSDRLRA